MDWRSQESTVTLMSMWQARGFSGIARNSLAVSSLLVALLIWLWPIGAGGKMPVGGDVTQFFLGLMGFLSASLKQGRLPIWNDLWGYGFPGIGESQMGVYYPPHLLLYRCLGTEHAYVASLILHTVWAGLGTWWAARQFGVSPLGSAFAGFVFSASGFFVIHMPHPWGYTTGSWLPWAWGLAWSVLTCSRESQPVRVLLLSAVLVLQLLPGHFQIGFMTQTGILFMVGWTMLKPWSGTESTGAQSRPPWGSRRTIASLLVVACLAVVPALAAAQLWPTARLARLAADQRDFNYLSLCASTPLHMVSFVAPGLFHRSSLWRDLVWTPFHTSPEEHLAYVGLVPLYLAILVAGRELRRDPAVRMLAALAALTALLCLGPFMPGFRFLISLPGFSFFRAPARWSVTTSLALAILAGKGLDRCRSWRRPGRSLAALAVSSIVWIGLVVGLVELALRSDPTSGVGSFASAFEAAFRMRPWSGDPDFRSVAALARKPFTDARIPPEVERAGIASRPRDPRSFMSRRAQIYRDELAGTAGILAGVLAVALLSKTFVGRAFLPVGLFLLTFVDLMILAQHRLVDIGPLRPPVEQSPVLARLAEEPRGTRVADRAKNLSMLVGLAPVAAYRTLDLPALGLLTSLAQGPLSAEPFRGLGLRAARAVGVGVRVLDPDEVAVEALRPGTAVIDPEAAPIDDPALASWLLGPSWVIEQGRWATRFRVIHPVAQPSRAWFIPLTAVSQPAMLDAWNGGVLALLDVLDQAKPLETASPSPTRLEVLVEVREPGWVLVSQLADPQWQASWSSRADGRVIQAEILPTFRHERKEVGWQRIRIPEPGRWTLHLEYVADDVRQGIMITAVAWSVWILVLGAWALRSRR
jgi:hypothetical protein